MKKANIKGVIVKDTPATSHKKAILLGTLAVAVVGLFAWSQFCCDKKDSFLLPVTDKGAVVATVGGENIRLTELQKAKDSIPQLKDIPMEVVYKQLLEAYINNKIVLDAAKKDGLQNDEAVKKAMKDAEDQILFQAFLAKQLKARMTPDKLQAIYQEEVKNFVPQDEIRARHILVATQKEANDIIVQLKAGADFATLANKYSLDKDPNALNGGDLGYFTKGMMIPEFADAAFATAPGKFSTKPVKTAFGWHVIKVEDKRKSAPPSYGEVEDAVKARFAEVMATEIIQEQRGKAQVQIFDIFAAAAPTTITPAQKEAPAPVIEEEEVEIETPAVDVTE